MKKKKRFYNNKKRNQKWTEEEKGRKIDFADKYIEGSEKSDKYDSKRPKKSKNTAINRAKKQKRLKNLIIAVICVALIGAGYTGMDIYMTMKDRSYNAYSEAKKENIDMKESEISFASYKTQSISLDASVMLSSVIHEKSAQGFTSITFEAKRDDGTIGYTSSLASVDTFGAMNSVSSKPAASIKELSAYDLMPIARISCYKDNIVPAYLPEAAVQTEGGKIYKDKDSNSYLNPDSELTYGYIKDIVQELATMGVRVFVLSNTDLPEEIADSYGGGFNFLANKLYSDIDFNIKLLEEKDVSLTGTDAETGEFSEEALDKEIKKLKKIDKNKAYYIYSAADIEILVQKLAQSNITSYIINQE